MKPDDRLILFSAYGGRKYDDSPKVIYEQMLKDERFKDYKLKWAFIDPSNINLPSDEKIKSDTLKYFITALQARVWITNSSMERGLAFKQKNTFYLNTWHGTPIKKLGQDVVNEGNLLKAKGESKLDVFLTQCEYEVETFSHAFNYPKDIFRLTGSPRNDILAHYTLDYAKKLRAKLNMPQDKKVILYAPTFREYEKNSWNECVLSIPMNLDYWQKTLGEEYILLFRAHYEVAKSMNITDNVFVRDMSMYPQLEDLMIVSDILISDYSSILFDFSIMHKPMYCFTYDYEKYISERGVYFDIREYLPTADNEVDLIELIMNGDSAQFHNKAVMFQEKFVTVYGSAATNALDIIADSVIGVN